MQLNKAQIIIIAVLLGLVGILVYINYQSATPEVLPETPVNTQASIKPFDFDAYLSNLKDSVDPATWQLLQDQTQLTKSADVRIFEIAGLATLWDSLGFKLPAAHYFSMMAEKLNDENSWFNAGIKFYEFAPGCLDTSMQIYAYQRAAVAFEKVVILNPSNLEAKNALAVCYTQNDQNIMKGVQLLKDVLKQDSNNIDANYTLGMLSFKSNQIDKAIMRFEALTRIDPKNPVFHFYLGEAYSQADRKYDAIKSFENFKALVPDEETKKNIDITINNLKNSK